MDKKNTMLLTVIAVATLLVAVVGATFAYFTATATDNSGTTIVTADTEQVAAAITLTTPTAALDLNLTAADMAQDNLNAYWATDSEESYDTDPELREILLATVSEGGSQTAKYRCTATLSVTKSGTMATELKAGDAYIQFGGLLATVGTNNDGKVDLTELDENGYDVTFNLTGTKLTDVVTAAVAIENRNTPQTYLANKALEVKFEVVEDSFECQIVK